MGLFSRRSRKATSPRSTGRKVAAPVVTVAFRDLGHRDPLKNFSPDHGYAYLWPFPTPPRVGVWAVADGWDGESTVIVGAVGMPAQARGMTLKPLLRLVPPKDIAAAENARTDASHAWLDLARRAAHLPLTQEPPTRAPEGFDEIPPPSGKATTVKTADLYGDIWWKAHKLSLEMGRGSDEAEAFRDVAKHWYRERDRLVKEADQRRMARAIANVDLDEAIRNVRNRPRAEVEAMTFAGQPLWDWLKHVQSLEKSGQVEQALTLVEALIEAAEQEAAIRGREPAPAYTERAAIIHRKRRDYNAEVAVIERWMNACPPERRGPGALQGKLADRLTRARELASL